MLGLQKGRPGGRPESIRGSRPYSGEVFNGAGVAQNAERPPGSLSLPGGLRGREGALGSLGLAQRLDVEVAAAGAHVDANLLVSAAVPYHHAAIQDRPGILEVDAQIAASLVRHRLESGAGGESQDHVAAAGVG